jgi:pheromone a factor receptor
MTASNTAYTVFSGIGFILTVIPLYWHLESWNVGTCMYIIWTALACLVHFVDSIIWSGNAINWAPVWCDICTFTHCFTDFFLISDKFYSAVRIQLGVAVAWPACGLCIIRRLYHIASPTAVTTTRAEVRCRIRLGVAKDYSNIETICQKRREMIIDLLITIGIPVLQMLLGKRDLCSSREHNLIRFPFPP